MRGMFGADLARFGKSGGDFATAADLLEMIKDQAAAPGSGMRALRKKPENLTTGQRTALVRITARNKPLYKGYLIKEQLREAFRGKGSDGKALLADLVS